VNLVTGDPGELLQRLKGKGANSPADLLFTTDAGNLHAAKEAGLFQRAVSAALEAAVPQHLRDPDGQWMALAVRVRPIFYVKGKIDPKTVATYEQLADPKHKGKILVRSSE
jgi:iron(III) transport system substrate-binding protein